MNAQTAEESQVTNTEDFQMTEGNFNSKKHIYNTQTAGNLSQDLGGAMKIAPVSQNMSKLVTEESNQTQNTNMSQIEHPAIQLSKQHNKHDKKEHVVPSGLATDQLDENV